MLLFAKESPLSHTLWVTCFPSRWLPARCPRLAPLHNGKIDLPKMVFFLGVRCTARTQPRWAVGVPWFDWSEGEGGRHKKRFVHTNKTNLITLRHLSDICPAVLTIRWDLPQVSFSPSPPPSTRQSEQHRGRERGRRRMRRKRACKVPACVDVHDESAGC
jgi:hypothetical protein